MQKSDKKNEKDKWLLLDNQLCFRLYSASKAVTSAYGSILKPLDLTYPQYLMMLVLWEQDDVSVKQLGERLGLDSGTLSPMLKKMEAKKILIKNRESVDERVVTIKLTQKGLDLKKKARDVPTQLLCKIDLNVKELSELQKNLDGLLKNLS
jgi:DNA-binding MarR family transcriptional regulator